MYYWYLFFSAFGFVVTVLNRDSLVFAVVLFIYLFSLADSDRSTCSSPYSVPFDLFPGNVITCI